MEKQNQDMRGQEEERNQESEKGSSGASTPTPSSPSHEFSFTISFQSDDKITRQVPAPSSSFAIDLSPADEIFFHGHLLPLHLLSHLPVSPPRASTNSMDIFTLPIEHLVQNSTALDDDDTHTSKGKTKSKSFPLLGLPNWRKGFEVKEKENKEKHGKKKKLDHVTQVVKRYIRMVRPLLTFRDRKNKQAYSFSGNKEIRGEYKSAPASMRTSPTNSGLLVATPRPYCINSSSTSSSSDNSTMEELQDAIQAAIAHCKKSISRED